MYKTQNLPNTRIDVADSLRGIAVAGIILYHSVEHFNIFTQEPIAHTLACDQTVADVLAWLLSGKMYGIFAMLFGLSFFIMNDNQQQKGKNFSGSIDAKIKVQKNNFLDKITVKAVTKTYTYTEGQAIIPQLDTDYTISVPKGFTTIEKKTFDDKQLVAEVYGNTVPGNGYHDDEFYQELGSRHLCGGGRSHHQWKHLIIW